MLFLSSNRLPSEIDELMKEVFDAMKKLIAMLFVSLLLLCAAASAETPEGGWQIAGDMAMTEERQAVLDRALEGLLGVRYEPVAYLGYQVVAGMNHCFLCRATVVYPDAVPYLVLVYVYEGLDGHAEITRIVDFDISAFAVAAEE